MKRLAASAILIALLPIGLTAQTGSDDHVWHQTRQFEPYSTTAYAITGPIHLSGQNGPGQTEPDDTLILTFVEVEKSVEIGKVHANLADWGLGAETPAEVFELADDPGVLLQGSDLCGGETPARWVVLTGKSKPSLMMSMLVFNGSEAPQSVDASGLCGIYNFDAEA